MTTERHEPVIEPAGINGWGDDDDAPEDDLGDLEDEDD